MTSPADLRQYAAVLDQETAAVALLRYSSGTPGGGRPPGNFLTDVFPTAIQRVRMAFGADLAADPATWSWTDVTTYFQWEPGIKVTIGYAEAAAALTPASMTGVIRNDQANGGDFTIDNPLSPFWPNVRENTPVIFDLDLGYGPSVMFEGRCTTFKPTRDVGGAKNLVSFAAHGITRYVGRKDSAESPMYRFHMRANRFPTNTNLGWPDGDQQYHTLPTHYWSLQDKSGAVQGANTINPSIPLVVGRTGAIPQFGADTFLPGVDGMCRFNDGSSLQVSFPQVTPGGRIESSDPDAFKSVRTQILVRFDESAQSTLKERLGTLVDGTTAHVLTLRPSLDAATSIIVYLDADPTDGLLMYCDSFNDAGTTASGGAVLGGTVGIAWERGAYITVDIVQAGTDTEVRFGVIPLTVDPTDGIPTPPDIIAMYDVQILTGFKFWGLNSLDLGMLGNLAGGAMGQLSIYNGDDDTFPDRFPFALVGRSGDSVATRLYRLGVEQGVHIEIIGDASDIAMGPQSTSRWLQLVQECANVDLGLLLDGLGPGLTYIARTSLYSTDPALILDAGSGDELGPDDPAHDDQLRVNVYTATSGAGSTQTFTQTEGDLGTDAVGESPDGGEHRAAFDSDLYQIAAFKVGQGTVPGLRWPQFAVQFAKPITSAKAQRFIESLPGAHVKILDLQPGMPEPDVSRVLRGWSIMVNSKLFGATLNLATFDPYAVTMLAADSGTVSDFLGWLDTDPGVVTSGTVLPAECFYDDLTTGVGLWTSQGGWTVAADATVGRTAAGSMKITPPGAVAFGGAVTAALGPCTGGVTYLMQGWFSSAAGWADCRICVDWYDSSGAFISSSIGVGVAAPAGGAWMLSRQTFAAPANATQRIVRARQGGTPAASDVLWVDDVVFMPQLQIVTPAGSPVCTHDAAPNYADDIDGLYVKASGLKLRVLSITGASSPQTMVIDPAGLLKALPTGSTVSAWQPVVLGL